MSDLTCELCAQVIARTRVCVRVRLYVLSRDVFRTICFALETWFWMCWGASLLSLCLLYDRQEEQIGKPCGVLPIKYRACYS